MTDFNKIINHKLRIYHIKVTKWRKTQSGAYYYGTRNIEIPKPTNVYNFGVCLHEIGHVICRHGIIKKNAKDFSEENLIDRRPNYIHEYEAEQYAINELKKYHCDTHEYEMYAILYVLKVLTKYKNQEGKFPIPQEVIKWMGLNEEYWKNSHRVKLIRAQKVKRKEEIKIQFQFKPGGKFVTRLNKPKSIVVK